MSFDEGAVAAHARSFYGPKTIKTCGLYRRRVREERLEKTSGANELMDGLGRLRPARELEILRRLLRVDDERLAHCGMVGSNFRQRSGMRELEREKNWRME